MDNDLNIIPINLKKLFNENISFHVPEFQRNYEWRTSNSETAKDRQVNELFEDIYEAWKSEQDVYFVGTLITYYDSKDVDDDDFNKYYVIDGQQRLTTLSIIIRSYIKKLENSKDDDEVKENDIKIRSKISNAKKLFLKEIVKDENTSKEKRFERYIVETSNPINKEFLEEFYENDIFPDEKQYPNAKNLINAAKTLDSQFDKLSVSNAISLFEYIRDHLLFAWVETDKFEDGFVIFERQNDRGKDLTFSDKVKHHLLGELAKDKDKFKKKASGINKDWEDLQLKIQRKARINFDVFLRYFFLSTYGIHKTKDKIVPWLKNDKFAQTEIQMRKKPEEFIKILKSKVDDFINIRDFKNPNGTHNYSLEYIHSFFRVQQHFPILMAAYPLGHDMFKRASLLIEALVFSMKWADSKANYLENALKIENNLCFLLKDAVNYKKIEDKAKSGTKSKLEAKENKEKKFIKFEIEIRKLIEERSILAKTNIINPDFLRNKSGKGAPLMAKYIPWRVELQLRLEAKDSIVERKVDDDNDQDKTSLDIEHIIEWGDIETQQKSKGDLNIQEIRDLTNRVGNLCLLEWNINQNIIPGWTPHEKITTGKECYICEICKNSYYKQFNNPKIKQIQNYKFIFDIEQHDLKKMNGICTNNKCGTKFTKEHLEGYSESKIYHTSSMSTGKFVSSASVKTRENEVRNKYKFKKENTPWSEKNIINREKIYFHVLSQAFITDFDPYNVGYKIDKSKIHWKDLQ